MGLAISAARHNAPLALGEPKKRGGARPWGTWAPGLEGWATVVAGLYAAAFVAWVLLSSGPDHTSTVINDVAFLPVGISAALLAWRAAHAAPDHKTRRAWTLIGLAFFSWWCGDVVWFWFESVRHVQPFPSLADAGYLGFYPLLFWGLLSLPGAPQRALDRTKVWLDTSIVVLGSSMVIWYLVIQPTVAGNEAHLLDKALSVAYPVGDLVVVFGVAMLLSRRPARGSAALRLLVVGASLHVIADVTFARLNLSNPSNGLGIPNVFWMAALFFLLAAAALQRRLEAQPHDATALDTGPARVSKLPYLALAVGCGFMLWVAWRETVSPLNGLLVGAVGLTLLVAVRQLTAQQENLRLSAALAELAASDSLTGLRNRRSFFELADHEWLRSARSGAPLTAVMVDIDSFKSINDTHSHAAGDEVLVAVASRCRQALRSIDVLGRYGGDELVALLPDSAAVDAVAIAERLRAAVAVTPVPTDFGPVDARVSVGVATTGDGSTSLRALLSQADAALYAAKAGGRNQSRAWYPGIAVPT